MSINFLTVGERFSTVGQNFPKGSKNSNVRDQINIPMLMFFC